MFFKRKNKANLYQIQNFTLFIKAGFFKQILLKNCKKQVHKGYPLAGPCICNYKLELALAIRNNLLGSSRHVFPFFLSESNEGPIRAHQKREDLSKPYRSLWGRVGIFDYCKADPTLKKRGGTPVYYCPSNIIGFSWNLMGFHRNEWEHCGTSWEDLTI